MIIRKKPGNWRRRKRPTHVGQVQGQGQHGSLALPGQEGHNIKKLADAAGFHDKDDLISKQFAHASGIMVKSLDGRIARYLYGIEYNPGASAGGRSFAAQNRIARRRDLRFVITMIR